MKRKTAIIATISECRDKVHFWSESMFRDLTRMPVSLIDLAKTIFELGDEVMDR